VKNPEGESSVDKGEKEKQAEELALHLAEELARAQEALMQIQQSKFVAEQAHKEAMEAVETKIAEIEQDSSDRVRQTSTKEPRHGEPHHVQSTMHKDHRARQRGRVILVSFSCHSFLPPTCDTPWPFDIVPGVLMRRVSRTGAQA